MDFKDYYAVLGLARGATDKEIRKAYRRLAREHHPDVNPDDAAAADRFREISEAYEVLGDAEKRELYDRYGREWRDAQRAAEAGVDFDAWRRAQRAGAAGPGPGDAPPQGQTQYTYATAEDLEDLFGEAGYSEFFESLFGRARGGRAHPGGPRPPAARKGRDVEAPVTVTLAEAYAGGMRRIQKDGRELEVRIPPGVREGSKVRLRGEGGPGLGDGPSGDLYLVLSVAEDPDFSRRGDDLEVRVDVPVSTAALGGEVRVPTMDGAVSLRIPAGTQGGQRIRLRGKGMPLLADPTRFGDLFARVQLRIPEPLDDDARGLFEQLRDLEAGS